MMKISDFTFVIRWFQTTEIAGFWLIGYYI